MRISDWSSDVCSSDLADIALRGGRIAAIGKAGNPDIQPGVEIIIGPGTEIIAGEGKIVTAGGVDPHIHFIRPQQIVEAIASGVTTMVGGGTGPARPGERRVGIGCVSTSRSRWSRYHAKQYTHKYIHVCRQSTEKENQLPKN